jgi:aspartyl-tRNA(Asn)/glutamyl-tRNA(Gln) amidotransferase subunit A
LPIGIKDLEDAAGLPTRYGSLLSSEKPVETDSVLVARLRAAGCVVIGKTTTPEYGHKGVTESKLTGVTSNPWNYERSSGGSSGGSGAALASGMVPLATGSDGGGSIRLPAAVCGLSAIKTTQGRIANGGINPPGSGLCTVKGPMARTATDTAFALDVCVGPHPTDPFSLPRSGAPWYEAATAARLPSRVAWSPTMGYATPDREILAICSEAIDRMAAAGVDIVPVDSVWDEDPVAPWLTMWTANRARSQGHLVDTADWDSLEPSNQFLIEMGLKASAVDYALAVDAVHTLNLGLDAVFEHAPLLITPTCAGHAPFHGKDGTIDGVENRGWVSYTYGLNMTRNPAATINCGFTADGMPVGLQIIGRQLDDVAVLQAMASLEKLLDATMNAPLK